MLRGTASQGGKTQRGFSCQFHGPELDQVFLVRPAGDVGMPGRRLGWLDGKGQGKDIAGEEVAARVKLLVSLCGEVLTDGPDSGLGKTTGPKNGGFA